ncbi:MAG TPA: DUF5996 family protein [Gemmatimonadota bacterium]|nr:DUF5996 family protein [Gemmatimonadota bacterium]
MGAPGGAAEPWPDLPQEAWRESCETLHMWTQIVGKIRLAAAPHVNHWWQVPLYVTPRGLTTSTMHHGRTAFRIDFDFHDHALQLETSEGAREAFPLGAYTVAEFYARIVEALARLELEVPIWPHPVEVVEAIPFEEDTAHAAYDPEAVRRFWRILLHADRALHEHRSGFLGKASPVHFFWGSFDMALTFFSGRTAPPHPGGVPHLADRVAREAYSHECASAGFWPGNGAPAIDAPAFYAYAYPEPEGYAAAAVRPAEAFYSDEMREFVLPYDAVRRAEDPEGMLRAFFSSTYGAAADLGGWDREALEREGGPGAAGG